MLAQVILLRQCMSDQWVWISVVPIGLALANRVEALLFTLGAKCSESSLSVGGSIVESRPFL